MEKKGKQLLLKDLCARLPYRVLMGNKEWNRVPYQLTCDEVQYAMMTDDWDDVPYLRPISSMTEEEVNTLFRILNINEDNKTEWLKINDIGVIRLFTQEGKDFYEIAEAMDYLNSIHIDYRGLIERNLAIDCTNLHIYD